MIETLGAPEATTYYGSKPKGGKPKPKPKGTKKGGKK